LSETYAAVLYAGLGFAALAALSSVFVRSPYGRFATRAFGPSLPIRAGWLLMEAPAALFYVFFFTAPRSSSLVPLLFAAVWTLHYGNRAIYFPLRMRPRSDGRMAWVVVLMGAAVVAVHAWLYARWLGELGAHLTAAWLRDPRFLLGLPLYLGGFALNVHSDAVLRRLRSGAERGYRIPRGGGFRYVSCPHYLGELLAWTGLALATWCPGGLFVLAVSAANLVPRARAIHRWYRRELPGYPEARRALIPFLW